MQNKLGDLGHLEEIPEPRAGLALGPGLLPPPLALPAGGTWGIEGLVGASAKDWDMGGHVRAAVPLFHPGKTTIHLRQVSKPLPNLEVQPAACASPVCSRPGTGILPPPPPPGGPSEDAAVPVPWRQLPSLHEKSFPSTQLEGQPCAHPLQPHLTAIPLPISSFLLHWPASVTAGRERRGRQ